ncbi:hypothetical protein AB0L41_43820 [Amycolatopsis mediterranei]|uniref:hypothetical protein n=1 Tax=Amycolatopsis mediterranei TaxID=33910 RepID=UPI0034203268
MAAIAAEQVRAAREQGYAAGYGLAPPTPNPYTPAHVPEWLGPRTPAERAHRANVERGPLALARVWRQGYQDGQAAYARERSAGDAS